MLHPGDGRPELANTRRVYPRSGALRSLLLRTPIPWYRRCAGGHRQLAYPRLECADGRCLRSAAKGMTMTTDHHAVTARRIPQLIPHRLLRGRVAHHPAVLEEAERRSRNFQLRLADRITTFAGSMNFVWIHAALFAVWMLLVGFGLPAMGKSLRCRFECLWIVRRLDNSRGGWSCRRCFRARPSTSEPRAGRPCAARAETDAPGFARLNEGKGVIVAFSNSVGLETSVVILKLTTLLDSLWRKPSWLAVRLSEYRVELGSMDEARSNTQGFRCGNVCDRMRERAGTVDAFSTGFRSGSRCDKRAPCERS